MSTLTDFYERHPELKRFFGTEQSFCTWVGLKPELANKIPDEKVIVEELIEERRKNWKKR